MQLARPLPDASESDQRDTAADDAIDALRLGLEEFFASLDPAVEFDTPRADGGHA